MEEINTQEKIDEAVEQFKKDSRLLFIEKNTKVYLIMCTDDFSKVFAEEVFYERFEAVDSYRLITNEPMMRPFYECITRIIIKFRSPKRKNLITVKSVIDHTTIHDDPKRYFREDEHYERNGACSPYDMYYYTTSKEKADKWLEENKVLETLEKKKKSVNASYNNVKKFLTKIN